MKKGKCIACGYSAGGEIKGVNKVYNPREPGKSYVGLMVRNEGAIDKSKEKRMEDAKYMIKRSTYESKRIQPKLQGLSKGGCVNCGFDIGKYKR